MVQTTPAWTGHQLQPKMTTTTSATTCGDKGHGDGEVDVPVEEQGPEVGSGASRASAQDKEAEPELNRM